MAQKKRQNLQNVKRKKIENATVQSQKQMVVRSKLLCNKYKIYRHCLVKPFHNLQIFYKNNMIELREVKNLHLDSKNSV